MRQAALVLNSVTVLFFVGFLAYTFVAREHLTGLAREYVTVKTAKYSDTVISTAEQSLDAELVRKLLGTERQQAIRAEIAAYRANKSAYIADLTRQKQIKENTRLVNPLLKQVDYVKEKIRTYYDETLTALIQDLRIFSTSNLIAALLGWWLAFRSPEAIRLPVVWFAILMFVAVVYSSVLYIDDLSFFRILFRLHPGLGYPLGLVGVLAWLYKDFGHMIRSEQSEPKDTANQINQQDA